MLSRDRNPAENPAFGWWGLAALERLRAWRTHPSTSRIFLYCACHIPFVPKGPKKGKKTKRRNLGSEVDLLRERLQTRDKEIDELKQAVMDFGDNLVKANERVLRLTDIVLELSKPKPKPAADTGVSEVL